MTSEWRNHLCLIFSQILPWKWQIEEYSNGTALGFTENHCLAVTIYISPQDCQTRAKHAQTVNNYLTVSLLLLSCFCEEAVLRQEKQAQQNQSQLNSHRAAPGDRTTQQTGNQSSPPLCPRLSAQRPATEKEL